MRRFLRFLLRWLVAPIFIVLLGLFVLYLTVRHSVPDLSPLQTFTPLATTRLLDRSGEMILVFQDPRLRLWTTIDHVPKDVIDAVISAEDPNFFTHDGVDLSAIWEAAKIDIQNMAYVRGASTLTQQLMKNLFLTREKTLTRKMKEVVLATDVEKVLPKRTILEQYLNQVQWGENLYGIESASRFYFGKPAEKLQIQEGAMLAGMLPNPKYFNPYIRFERLRVRQRVILKLMWQYRKIDKARYEQALAAPLALASASTRPYAVSDLKERYRPKPAGYRFIIEDTLEDYLGTFQLWQGGSTIRTTLDLDSLKQADKLLGRSDSTSHGKFAIISTGPTIVAFGLAPEKPNAAFEKWLKSQSYTSAVAGAVPWDQVILQMPAKKE